jgi:hypothetical protein
LAPQLTQAEALARLSQMEAPSPAVDTATGTLYCSECYLPLHPDPKPEKLYIFLHALRYTTSLGCFETDIPEWAAEGWKWDQGWTGTVLCNLHNCDPKKCSEVC